MADMHYLVHIWNNSLAVGWKSQQLLAESNQVYFLLMILLLFFLFSHSKRNQWRTSRSFWNPTLAVVHFTIFTNQKTALHLLGYVTADWNEHLANDRSSW